jgi:hypothetical protein
MAIERRIIVGIEDIKAVTFEWTSCGARTPVPISSLSEVPQHCNSCKAVWWRSNDFATHVSTIAGRRCGLQWAPNSARRMKSAGITVLPL